MPRHKFTESERLLAMERALKSPDTPKQLLASLRLRADKLRRQLAKQKSQRPGFLGTLRTVRSSK